MENEVKEKKLKDFLSDLDKTNILAYHCIDRFTHHYANEKAVKLLKELFQNLYKDFDILHSGNSSFYIYGKGRVIELHDFRMKNLDDDLRCEIVILSKGQGWSHLFRFKDELVNLKNILSFVSLKKFKYQEKFVEWNKDLKDFKFYFLNEGYPFYDHYYRVSKGTNINKEQFVYEKETVVEYKDKGKVYFTVRLMKGCRMDYEFSRFRRQPLNDTWGPIYMHGQNGVINTDYSTDRMFIQSPKDWSESLCEVPYLTNIKKMQLVKKNGEIFEFTNKTSHKLQDMHLSVKTNPVIEIRIF